MQSSIRMDRNVPVEMRDGVVLRADIYRPDDNQKHPAILIRTPYNKLSAGSTDYLSVIDAAVAGYAVVAQDTRGRFTSEGEYPHTFEARDSYDTVEWVAAQPWCDGNVGMQGGSYLAVIQWEAAMQDPPHLQAIVPLIGRAGPLQEMTLFGGVASLHLGVTWTAFMGVDIADKLEKQGKDVSEMRRMVNRVMFNPEEVYNFLPLKDAPHFKFEGLLQSWRMWVLNAVPGPDILPEKNAYYPYHKVKVPCFQVGGWYDFNTGALFKNLLGMRENAGSPRARQGQHLICGPWAHDARLPRACGDLDFGPVAAGGAAFVSQRIIQFFDKYLRGIDVEIPAIRYFVMGRNMWQNADTWPLPQTRWQRFFFHSQGHANTAGGDGLLTRDEPGSEPPDIFAYNPHFPVPTTGGRQAPQLGLVPGPREQSRIEKRNDVLCYTTPELDEDIEVTGPLELHLLAATSARDTDFTVKLVDVYPDGSAFDVAEGIIRARYRKSIFQPELVNPGEVNEYTINMAATGNLFRRGHRIRLDISSSNFPRFDRNMNTGNPIGEDAQGIPAMQTIYHQADYQSYIDLPVIPGKSA